MSLCGGPLTSPTREFLARRVVDALERVERGEPEEQDEPDKDDHVLEPVRPDELAAEVRVTPVRREVAAQRRLLARREPGGTFYLLVRAVELRDDEALEDVMDRREPVPVRKSNVRVNKPKTPRTRTPSTLVLRRT